MSINQILVRFIYAFKRFSSGGIDNTSLSAVGLLTSEVKKMYPEAVVINRDGFEQINEKELIQKDEFIRNLIKARKIDGASSCTRVVGTKFRLCF